MNDKTLNAIEGTASWPEVNVDSADWWRTASGRLGIPVDAKTFEAALRHSINYNSIDAKAGMADHALAELLMPEICKHLAGSTDVQVFERMTPEERANIGKEEN